MEYDLKSAVDEDDIRRQSGLISEKKIADIVAEYADDFVGVLNSTRQFVMLNADYFGNAVVISNLLGKRPGDVFNCIHSEETEYGCGNSPSCGYCGAVSTVKEAIITNRRVSRDSRILVERNETLNVRVTAIPINIETEVFILLFLKDISKEKRLEMLERAFFHDILNTSNSLKSLVALSEVRSQMVPGADKSIEMGVSDIVEQIEYYRRLKMAETGELEVIFEPVNLSDEISQIVSGINSTAYGNNKNVVLVLPSSGDSEYITDRVLFRRIVLNLLKNALEASNTEESVELRLEESHEKLRLSVHNRAVMSSEVKHQIFQRSFSTKGPGRGIGTYSIKLLTEQYLGGSVSFTSEAGEGTIFTIELPVR